MAALLWLSLAGSAALHAAGENTDRQQIIALNHSSELSRSLLQALAGRGKDSQPRTEHLLADGSPRYINRLIREDSPYLAPACA